MGGKSYAMGKKYNSASSVSGATQQFVNELGVVHLSYSGQRCRLKEGVVDMNLVGKPGVPGD